MGSLRKLVRQNKLFTMEYHIVDSYLNGESVRKIHKRIDISRVDISAILGSHGVSLRNRRRTDYNKLTPDMVEKIIDLYSNGIMSQRAICEEFSIERCLFRKILKDKGVETRSYLKIPRKIFEEIVDFADKKNPNQIARKLRIDRSTVFRILERRNLKIKRYLSPDHPEIFKHIDDEFKAYWLGFLYADGCVSDQNVVKLTLSFKDREHIFKYRRFVGANTKSSVMKNSIGMYLTTSFTSQKMARDLISHGCVPRKSLILSPPDTIPKNLIKHFIRGHFDGDGCVHISRKNNRANINICGTFNMCVFLKEHFHKNGISSRVEKHHKENTKNTYRVYFSGNRQVLLFFNKYYLNNKISLKRKENRFRKLLKRFDIGEIKRIKASNSKVSLSFIDRTIRLAKLQYPAGLDPRKPLLTVTNIPLPNSS